MKARENNFKKIQCRGKKCMKKRVPFKFAFIEKLKCSVKRKEKLYHNLSIGYLCKCLFTQKFNAIKIKRSKKAKIFVAEKISMIRMSRRS